MIHGVNRPDYVKTLVKPSGSVSNLIFTPDLDVSEVPRQLDHAVVVLLFLFLKGFLLGPDVYLRVQQGEVFNLRNHCARHKCADSRRL